MTDLTPGIQITAIGMGLVFGPWLVLPGLAMLAWTAWSWVTQLQAPR